MVSENKRGKKEGKERRNALEEEVEGERERKGNMGDGTAGMLCNTDLER